jgi:UDP-N-acetylglucosamine--N-acetylmuramyl-(pentapeptide) pyrophosphoryl-undecaprenol N-acetylglucosamine transferase
MERFFPAGKIQVTGNPVRTVLEQPLPPREEACRFFGLDPARKVLLSLGGSLGARTINESLAAGVCRLPEDIQLLWQTGPGYYERAAALSKEHPGVQVHAFIQRMEMAFSAADMVISRAGAGTISELSILGKPCILVPSPNVAEDHQTRNAEVLAKHGAALMISDASAREQLFPKAIQCIRDEQACLALAAAIRQFAHPGASEIIAKKVLELCVR